MTKIKLKDKVYNLLMNFKNEMKSQFGISRKSNENVYYSRPKVQTHIHADSTEYLNVSIIFQ